jgi:hypothetical protein
MMPIFQSALFAAVAGFLTRPCCVIPVALSFAGVGSAGLSSVFMTYRPVFFALSAICVGVSTWLTFRRPGGVLTRWFAVLGGAVAFFISAGYTGVLNVF